MLGDHAAHAHAQYMELPHVQRRHQAQRIVGHVSQAVGRCNRQAELVAQRLITQVGSGRRLVPTGQAHIAVVVANHPKALLAQGDHHFIGPMNQLPAQTHDQQKRRVGFAADTLVSQADLGQLCPLGRYVDRATLCGKGRKAAHECGQKQYDPHEKHQKTEPQ
ncbi:hypothetical protein D3C85_762530 [compost metagenome]